MGYFNPLLQTEAGRRLAELPDDAKAALSEVLNDLRQQANSEAEKCWRRRKGPMAAYWRAVATYARHVRHALRRTAP